MTVPERPSLLERLRGRLVVSCQARPDMPLRQPPILLALGQTAILGGAAGLRMEGIETLRVARSAIDPAVPIIGLWKIGPAPGVFITPTVVAALAVAETGVDIVALDATRRHRPDGMTLAASVQAIHDRGRLALGDIATLDDGQMAADSGVDAVATTLYGYTGGLATEEPSFELIAELSRRLPIPVLAEGHIRTPGEARRALDVGAFSVIVGSAITRPEWITGRFVDALGLNVG